MKTNSNISQELLEKVERYYDRTMPAEERTAFETQLQNDLDFKTQVDETRTLLLGIETQALKERLDLFHETMPDRKKDNKKIKIRNYKWMKIASAAVIIIALGCFWLLSPPSHEQLFDHYFTPDPGLPTTMSSSDNFAFFDAMVNYKQGDYKKAISKWEVLEKKSPENDTINYFLGVAYLADKNIDKSIPYLNKTISSSKSVFMEDAYFYLGLAYLKLDQMEQAKQAFQKSQSEKSQEVLKALQ